MGPRSQRVRRVGFACREGGSEVGWGRDKRTCGRATGQEREREIRRGREEESRRGECTDE